MTENDIQKRRHCRLRIRWDTRSEGYKTRRATCWVRRKLERDNDKWEDKRIFSSNLAPARFPEGFAVLAYQFPPKVNSRRTTLSSGNLQGARAVTTEELLFDCKLRKLFLGDNHIPESSFCWNSWQEKVSTGQKSLHSHTRKILLAEIWRCWATARNALDQISDHTIFLTSKVAQFFVKLDVWQWHRFYQLCHLGLTLTRRTGSRKSRRWSCPGLLLQRGRGAVSRKLGGNKIKLSPIKFFAGRASRNISQKRIAIANCAIFRATVPKRFTTTSNQKVTKTVVLLKKLNLPVLSVPVISSRIIIWLVICTAKVIWKQLAN